MSNLLLQLVQKARRANTDTNDVANIFGAMPDEEYFAGDSLTKPAFGGINEKAKARKKSLQKKQ